MKNFLVSILTVLALGSLGACNTVEGVGKDIKKGGEVIEKAAK